MSPSLLQKSTLPNLQSKLHSLLSKKSQAQLFADQSRYHTHTLCVRDKTGQPYNTINRNLVRNSLHGDRPSALGAASDGPEHADFQLRVGGRMRYNRGCRGNYGTLIRSSIGPWLRGRS